MKRAHEGIGMERRGFPPAGFLLLGVSSIAAAAVFLIRAAGVEATAERLWSAVIFAAMGVFWLVAYWMAHRTN